MEYSKIDQKRVMFQNLKKKDKGLVIKNFEICKVYLTFGLLIK